MKKIVIFVFIFSFCYSIALVSGALIDDFYYSGSTIQIKEIDYNVTLSSDYSKVFIKYKYGSAIFDFGECTIENHLEFCVEEYELLDDEENIRKLELKVNEEECVSKKILGNNTGECLLRLGSSCINNTDCLSNHCVHDVCTPTDPFCGDNKCDENETCYADCNKKSDKSTETEIKEVKSEQEESVEVKNEEKDTQEETIQESPSKTTNTDTTTANEQSEASSPIATEEPVQIVEYVQDTETSKPYMLWILFGIGVALITINSTKFYTIFRYGK